MALTYGNIKTELASTVRFDLNKADQDFLIGQWTNLTIQDMNSRASWYWTVDRQIVQTVADKTAGTVSISVDGTTVTGASTAFASGDVGKYIQFSSSDDWYKITTFTSSTSIEIEAPYTQTSALSGGTYTIRKFFYSLSSTADEILSVRQHISPTKMNPVHYREFDIFYPSPEGTSKGEIYVPWGLDSSDNLVFSIYPWPDEIYNVEVRFKKKTVDLTSAAQQPSIPEKFRSVILDGALSRALRHPASGGDIQKAELVRRAYEDGISRMEDKQNQAPDYHPIIRSVEGNSRYPLGPSLPQDFDRRYR